MNDYKIIDVTDEHIKEAFALARKVFLVCDAADYSLQGIGADHHASLIFVDLNYQKKGIARALMDEIITRLRVGQMDKITLNSTPYAVGFYQRYGFVATGAHREKHRVLYMPMEIYYNEKGVELIDSSIKTLHLCCMGSCH